MPRYWKRCLKVKWMPIWGMKRIPWPVITVAIHATAAIRSESRLNMGKLSSPFRVIVMASLEPIAVPKHESRGLSIEKLVIFLYAKGMSVSDIEEEMREIYEIEFSTSAISIIINKVNQAAKDWQNRPLDPICLIVWMDCIVFKVRDNGKIINKTVYLCAGLKKRSEGGSWNVGRQI